MKHYFNPSQLSMATMVEYLARLILQSAGSGHYVVNHSCHSAKPFPFIPLAGFTVIGSRTTTTIFCLELLLLAITVPCHRHLEIFPDDAPLLVMMLTLKEVKMMMSVWMRKVWKSWFNCHKGSFGIFF